MRLGTHRGDGLQKSFSFMDKAGPPLHHASDHMSNSCRLQHARVGPAPTADCVPWLQHAQLLANAEQMAPAGEQDVGPRHSGTWRMMLLMVKQGSRARIEATSYLTRMQLHQFSMSNCTQATRPTILQQPASEYLEMDLPKQHHTMQT